MERELWEIANLLRGKMSADRYRDYILEFIFFKYLSEKQYIYANDLLEGEDVADYRNVKSPEILSAIYDESITKLGYCLKPEELFSTIVENLVLGYV